VTGTLADGTRIVPDGPFDTDDAQYLIEAAVEGAGITQFMRLAIEDDLAAGRLGIVLPEIPMFTTPVYVLHPFGANSRCGRACSSIFWSSRWASAAIRTCHRRADSFFLMASPAELQADGQPSVRSANDFRLWHKADIRVVLSNVRFWG
jgi:hypothetical protein